MKKTITILLLLLNFYGHASTIYVNANANGNNNGTSWENAFNDFQAAINLAQYGDEIWVAQGIYHSTLTTDRYIYFELKNGVKWYGGFEGNETTLDQRDPSNYISLLSGDIGIQNDSTDNSFTIVYSSNTDSTTILDGFTLAHGNANSASISDPFISPPKCGGALYIETTAANQFSEPVINNCIFQNNSTLRFGGAIYFNAYSSQVQGNSSTSPLFSNCQFSKNYAQNAGGAIYKGGGSETGHDQYIINCTFNNNKAFQDGGAIFIELTHGFGEVIIDSCSFDNHSARFGGVIHIRDHSPSRKISIKNSRFFNYSSNIQGSAILLHTDPISNLVLVGDIKKFNLFGCHFHRNNEINTNQNNSTIIMGYDDLWDIHTPTISILDCIFENHQLNDGRGILSASGLSLRANLSNCMFLNNGITNANSSISGLIYIQGDDTTIRNSLFINNRIGVNGTLLQGSSNPSDTSNFSLENSIFWNNGTSSEDAFYINGTETNFHFQNCLIDVDSCSNINPNLTDGSNISCTNMLYNQYPDFVDTLNEDFRLKPCSPAVNFGDNNFLDSTLIFDLYGQPRVSESIVDLGPYENAGLSIEHITDTLCFGENNGTVMFSLEHASLPFDYEWENENNNGISNTDLAAGNYDFTISDQEACTRTANITINESEEFELASIITPVSGEGQNDGIILVGNFAGGTLPYTYLWSTGDTTTTISNLSPDSYSLTITDANDCQYEYDFEVDILSSISSTLEQNKNTISPNPIAAQSNFSLNIGDQFTGQMEVTIFNAQGQILSKNTFWKSNITPLSIPLIAPKSTGAYFLMLSNEGKNINTLPLIVY